MINGLNVFAIALTGVVLFDVFLISFIGFDFLLRLIESFIRICQENSVTPGVNEIVMQRENSITATM